MTKKQSPAPTSEPAANPNANPSTQAAEQPKKSFWDFFKKKPPETPNPEPKKPDDSKRFHTNAQEGLTTEQVEERKAKGLVNTEVKKYSKTYKSIILGNIFTFFNFLCLFATVALLLAGADFTQFTFVFIYLINIVFSIVQEINAKVKIDKLALLTSPTAKVIRDGKKIEIPVNEIVVDDVLILSAGQQVPVDCIALEGLAEFNESLLTGESVPIKKDDGDVLFAGSFVASGQMAARVDKVGNDTYISKLSEKAQAYKRPNSEIMNSITLFIKIIGFLIIPIAVLMFFNNFHNLDGSWETVRSYGGFFPALFSRYDKLCEAVQKSASVVIGMIPSGLFLLTTVAMSVGMIRLTKYNTLVQDMYSLEMLARVNVLCLDKTGTITDGRMRVSDCILLNNMPNDYGVDDIIGSMLASLNDNNQTSIALYDRFGHSSALQPIATLPFSSARKLSAVTFEDVGTYVMGAPEFVLKPMPVRIDKIVKQYAQMGLRVLVLAHSTGKIQGDKVPAGLRAVAVITLSDNIRPDAIQTIQWFNENEVAVKVISGDNPVTVSEVARRAGVKGASRFISLEGLSDIEVENAANEYTVFGRVSPNQKAILIRALKKSGNTVAMTGDGVNDILAMKESDCAISVASGSEAARNVSNLVLQDNNFGSMPHIVNEGRRVINNIKNSSALYIMKTLLILFLSIFCIIRNEPYFFTTNNMMMYEFIISAVPSTVLSLQPNTERVKGKFIPYVLSRSIPGALTMTLSLIILYVVQNSTLAQSFGFVSIVDGAAVVTQEYKALLMIGLTFTGLVMLYRVCQPFNLLRVILLIVSVVGCLTVICVPFLSNLVFAGFSELKFTLAQVLLIIILVQAAFPVSDILIKFFDMMNPADEPSESKPSEPAKS